MKIILAHYGSDRHTRCIGLLNDTDLEIDWLNNWLEKLNVSTLWWMNPDFEAPRTYEEVPQSFDVYHTGIRGVIQQEFTRYIVRPKDNTPIIKKD